MDTYKDLYINTYDILFNVELCQIVNFWSKATCLTSKFIYIKFTDDSTRLYDDTIHTHKYIHTYIYIQPLLYVTICIYICMFVCIYVYTYVCVSYHLQT